MKNRINQALLLLLLVILPLSVEAKGKVEKVIEAVEVHSQVMGKGIMNTIVVPQQYFENQSQTYPVVFLLHGHGGSYKAWIEKTKKDLDEVATQWGIIFVCPDAENSWYWDSPVNSKSQYDTYISQELVSYMDKNYRTKADRDHRAITGYSMGGHGGMWLGINHPDVFGACGSMSGGIDIRPYPLKWHLADNLGSYKDHKETWENYTVMNILEKIEPGKLEIIIDCGVDDFFHGINEKLHQEMMYRNIPHDYIARPGAHKQAYWTNAIDYQLMFFSKFFKASDAKK